MLCVQGVKRLHGVPAAGLVAVSTIEPWAVTSAVAADELVVCISGALANNRRYADICRCTEMHGDAWWILRMDAGACRRMEAPCRRHGDGVQMHLSCCFHICDIPSFDLDAVVDAGLKPIWKQATTLARVGRWLR